MTGETNGGRGRAYEALRESEELHRATLSSISDAVFMTNDEGEFTYICPNVDVIFGWVPDEVQAMGRIGELLGLDLFDPTELEARGEIRNVEREAVSKSGERRHVLIHLKRVAIKGGTVLYTCRDVTELKQAERELAVTRLELAHAARLAVVGELAASILHETQQPLTAILANASLGLQLTDDSVRDATSSEIREIFRDIDRACRNAADISARLRTLVRKRPLERQRVDVNGIANDMLRLVAPDARRRQVVLGAELAPSLPMIDGDRVSLQHAVLILLVNAMEAMDQIDAGERQVMVRTRRAEAAVEVAVSDTGRGVAAQDLPRLFDPFFTTKEEGIGLGLPIARSIVEAHAGRIWAEHQAGGGALFRMTFPIPS